MLQYSLHKEQMLIPKFGTFKTKTVTTNRGKLPTLYVADTFNYPERLLMAIEVGEMYYKELIENENDQTLHTDIMVHKLTQVLEKIDVIKKSIKDKRKIIANLTTLTNEDEYACNELKFLLRDITKDRVEKYKDNKILEVYKELICTQRYVTQKMLAAECSKFDISFRDVKEMPMAYLKSLVK